MSSNHRNPFIKGLPIFLNGIGRATSSGGKTPGYKLLRTRPAYRKLTSRLLRPFFWEDTARQSKQEDLVTRIAYALRDSLQAVYVGGRGYSYEPYLNSTLSKPNDFALGFELECDTKTESLRTLLFSDSSSAAYDSRRPLISNWFFVKRDSSLDPGTGIEVVSIPLAERFCLNPELWSGLTQYLSIYTRAHNCTAYEATDGLNYGFHVHVNSGFFLSDEQTCLDTVSQQGFLVYANVLCSAFYYALYETYPQFIDHIFGRPINRYCFLPRPGVTHSWKPTLQTILSRVHTFADNKTVESDALDKTLHQMLSDLNISQKSILDFLSSSTLLSTLRGSPCSRWTSRVTGDAMLDLANTLHATFFCYDDAPRHACVNITSRRTIEFRQGRASLNPENLYLIVSFIYALCSFVKRLMQSQLQGKGRNNVSAERDLNKEFLTYVANHSANTYLRSLCSALLNGKVDPVIRVPLKAIKPFRLDTLTERQGD